MRISPRKQHVHRSFKRIKAQRKEFGEQNRFAKVIARIVAKVVTKIV